MTAIMNSDLQMLTVLPVTTDSSGETILHWDEIEMNEQTLGITPEESVSRLISMQRHEKTAATTRRGLCMMLEHGLMSTDRGREIYQMQLAQMTSSCVLSLYADALDALLSANMSEAIWNQRYGNQLTPSGMTLARQEEIQGWGALQRKDYGMVILGSRSKERFRTVAGIDPDTWILPDGVAGFAATVSGDFSFYNNGNSGVDAKMSAFSGGRTLLGNNCEILEARRVQVPGEAAPICLMSEVRSIGEYFMMAPPAGKQEVGCRDIMVYSETSDTYELISFVDALEATCRRGSKNEAPPPSLGGDPDWFDGIGPDVPTFGEMDDTYLPKAARRAFADSFVEYITAHMEDIRLSSGELMSLINRDILNLNPGNNDIFYSMVLELIHEPNPKAENPRSLMSEAEKKVPSAAMVGVTPDKLKQLILAAFAEELATPRTEKEEEGFYPGHAEFMEKIGAMITEAEEEDGPLIGAVSAIVSAYDSAKEGGIYTETVNPKDVDIVLGFIRKNPDPFKDWYATNLGKSSTPFGADVMVIMAGSYISQIQVGNTYPSTEASSGYESSAIISDVADPLYNSLSVDPIRCFADMLLRGCRRTIPQLKLWAEKGLYVPVSIILMRPFMTYECADALLVKKGCGKTVVSQPNFQLSDDVSRKVALGHFTLRSKSIVTMPKMVQRVKNVFIRKMLGGTNTKLFTSPAELDNYAPGFDTPSIFAVLVPVTRGLKRATAGSVGGYASGLHLRGISPSYEQDGFEGAAWFSTAWGLDENKIRGPTDPDDHDGTANGMCFRGSQFVWDPISKTPSRLSAGVGHWKTAYDGCAAARSGLQMYDPPQASLLHGAVGRSPMALR